MAMSLNASRSGISLCLEMRSEVEVVSGVIV